MVSFVSILAIITAVAVIGLAVAGGIMMRRTAEDQLLLEARLQARLQEMRTKLEQKIELTDLAEFRDLDPAYREAYKRMIVDKLMPAIVRSLNKDVAKIAPELKADGPLSQVVDKMVQALDGDIKAVQKMAATAAQPEQTIESFVDSDYFASRLTRAVQVATTELSNTFPRGMASHM